MVFRDTFEQKLFVVGIVYSTFMATFLLMINGDVFSAPDSFPHVYIPATIFKNGAYSKVANLGTVWLPLYHLLLSPLILFKPLYSTGVAATIINGAATGGILVYLARIVKHVTDRKDVLYGSIVLFLSHGYTAIYSATPMTEQLSIFLGLGGVYYFVRYWEQDHLPYFVSSSAFFVMATLTRYEFWIVAAAIVVAMGVKELRNGRSHNLAFFHLPLWGGFLWIVWNTAIFGDPLAFVASNTMAVSVGETYSMRTRVIFLMILPIIGGLAFLLPLFLNKRNRVLSIIPVTLFGLYIVTYLFEFVNVVSNMRFGYLLFGMLLPSIVVLRRVTKRKTLAILVILILSAVISSGFALAGVYADMIGPESRVQETTDNRVELPDGLILLPIDHKKYDMSYYPNSYRDPYDNRADEHAWIEASETPWNSDVDYVLIPPIAEDKVEEKAILYRDSGPNDGIVWHFYMNETWRERFLEHFELVDSEIGLYKKENSSTGHSVSDGATRDTHYGSEKSLSIRPEG